MARLNASTRRRIADHLIEDTFRQRTLDSESESVAIANAAYAIYMTPYRRKLATALPDEWFDKVNSISIAVGGMAATFSFSLDKSDYRPVGHDARRSYRVCDALSINTRTAEGKLAELGERVVRWMQESESIKEGRRSLTVKIKAVLDSVTTRSRLIEEWPEIAPTLDRIWPEETKPVVKTKAISVRMDQLNKELKLPEPPKSEQRERAATRTKKARRATCPRKPKR